MKKFITVVLMVLFFGFIGSLFGPIGAVIGVILGFIGGLQSDDDKKGLKQEINENSDDSGTFESGSSWNSSIKTNIAGLYEEVVPEMISLCIAADGEIEDDEVNLATNFIESDELIIDKETALQSLTLNIEELTKERKKSSAIFKLKSTTFIHKVNKINDSLQKERLLVILDGMLEIVKNDQVGETKNIVENIKKSINQSSLEEKFSNKGNISQKSTTQNKTNNNSQNSKSGYSSLLKTGAAVAGGALIGNALASSGEESAKEAELAEQENNMEQNIETSPDANETINDNIKESPNGECGNEGENIEDNDFEEDSEDGGGFFDLFED
jgi:hypothetical protein